MTNGLSVRHSGANLPSQPHIDMTIAILRRFGADVDSSQAGRWKVANGKLSGADIVIEPDLSNAAPFMAMTLLCGGELIIRDWPKATTQPGDRLRDIFTQMGGSMEFVPEGLKKVN
jgi:3-phosphoshikimate 1-carboxyvinyltransferase